MENRQENFVTEKELEDLHLALGLTVAGEEPDPFCVNVEDIVNRLVDERNYLANIVKNLNAENKVLTQQNGKYANEFIALASVLAQTVLERDNAAAALAYSQAKA